MKFKGIALPLISSLIFFACNRGVEPNHELSIMSSSDSSVAQEINDPSINKYGIPADSFDIVQGKIRQNTFISDILLKAGVPMQDIEQALNSSKNVFDVRKVLPGRNYALLYSKNNPGRASYMIYEHEPATDYVFSFNDSLNITAFKKKVNTVVQYASGTITSSLWEAIINQDLNPEIAVRMADIFAWTVDFFGLEKGDKFKIVYEENFIEGQSLGIKKILTAQFISSGKAYTAIPFIQDGTESYFDLDGNSLKKAFLKAPLKFSRISSHYTTSRLHPILKIRRPHLGVDYAAPTGTPVYSVGDGKVLSVTYDAASGRMIKIKHNSSYMTSYMHLSRFERGITPGTMVRQGQIIGYVGSTGLATGPHLDFRFYNNGTPVDPLKVTAPPAEPITEVNRDRFNMIKEVNLSLLNTI